MNQVKRELELNSLCGRILEYWPLLTFLVMNSTKKFSNLLLQQFLKIIETAFLKISPKRLCFESVPVSI